MMDTDELNSNDIQPKPADDAYETQLLGFTPSSFSNGIFNAFNQYMSDGLNAMKDIISKQHSDVITEKDLHKGMRDIQESIENQFESVFDHFECYLIYNVLKIPQNAVLPEDKIQQEEVLPEDENIDDQIDDLKEQIQALQFANLNLSEELKTADQTQAELDKLLDQLEENKSLISDTSAIKETAKQCLEEVDKLGKVIQSTCQHP